MATSDEISQAISTDRDSRVTDAGLRHLQDMLQLDTLCLPAETVTDKGLESLKGLLNLKFLYLAGSRVDGRGIRPLGLSAKIGEIDSRFGNGDRCWLAASQAFVIAQRIENLQHTSASDTSRACEPESCTAGPAGVSVMLRYGSSRELTIARRGITNVRREGFPRFLST